MGTIISAKDVVMKDGTKLGACQVVFEGMALFINKKSADGTKPDRCDLVTSWFSVEKVIPVTAD